LAFAIAGVVAAALAVASLLGISVPNSVVPWRDTGTSTYLISRPIVSDNFVATSSYESASGPVTS
jgi:hypothetical protein